MLSHFRLLVACRRNRLLPDRRSRFAHRTTYLRLALWRVARLRRNGRIFSWYCTVRLRTRRSHILRWAVGALDWYHSIWFLNCSLDDYFNRADCDPDLLPALRAFGEPLRAVCLFRSEQAQAAKVCMLGGIEKPSSLANRASDRPICFHCTIYCLFHAYLSFLIPCLTSILYADNP